MNTPYYGYSQDTYQSYPTPGFEPLPPLLPQHQEQPTNNYKIYPEATYHPGHTIRQEPFASSPHSPTSSTDKMYHQSSSSKKRTNVLIRVCCGLICLLLVVIVMLVIYFTAIFKIPKVAFDGASSPQNRQPLSILNGGSVIQFDWDFKFAVSNPNTLSIELSSLDFKGYPGTSSDLTSGNQIANGTLSDINFASNSNLNIQFPVTFQWNTQQPSNSVFFLAVMDACGLSTNSNSSNDGVRSKINVQYQVDIGLAILKPFNFKYPYRDNQSFDCPINLGGNTLVNQLTELIDRLLKP